MGKKYMILILILISIITVYWIRTSKPQTLKITFLSIGTGEAIFIQTPQNKNILIDGGSKEEYYLLRDFIDKNEISVIDAVISTHPHQDHVGGLIRLLEDYRVNKIYDSGLKINIPTYSRYLELIKELNIEYYTPRRGEKINIDSLLTIEVLHPQKPLARSSINNISLVLRLIYDEITILLPGDIKKEAESELIESEQNLQADILKVPFHGSRNASSQAFLENVNPETAVLIVGRNIFGHPHRETLDRIKNLNIELLRTDEDGPITITCNGINYNIVLGN